MQMKCKSVKKFALRRATCCIVQSDEKWDCIEMVETRRVVQKLQNGKK